MLDYHHQSTMECGIQMKTASEILEWIAAAKEDLVRREKKGYELPRPPAHVYNTQLGIHTGFCILKQLEKFIKGEDEDGNQ